jgi:soluble lytic murein transglycosylase-like protein
MRPHEQSSSEIVAIILSAAERHHVPADVALAIAWCESRFVPTAEGDLGWAARDGGKRYQRSVLRSPRLRYNPGRDDPQCWHSYGLFQLLACFHTGDNEHPSALLAPERNAEVACKFIRSLLNRTDDDPEAARLLYVGLPLEGASTENERRKVLGNFRAARERFRSYALKDDGQT